MNWWINQSKWLFDRQSRASSTHKSRLLWRVKPRAVGSDAIRNATSRNWPYISSSITCE
jgi:hypothetical protein